VELTTSVFQERVAPLHAYLFDRFNAVSGEARAKDINATCSDRPQFCQQLVGVRL
jgi:hypothetical protein